MDRLLAVGLILMEGLMAFLYFMTILTISVAYDRALRAPLNSWRKSM